MRNPLTHVNNKTRLSIYAVFSVIGLIVGGAQVGYASVEVAQPDWLTVALAVYAFVGGAIGYTAATHTNSDKPDVANTFNVVNPEASPEALADRIRALAAAEADDTTVGDDYDPRH